MNEQLIIALSLGLGSTLHCLGMCGPLTMALPLGSKSTTQRIFLVVVYHLSRISVYGLLGFLISLVGVGVSFLVSMQVISVLLGVLLIAIGLGKLLGIKLYFPKLLGFFTPKFGAAIHRLPDTARFSLMGMLNGILPCGMVFIALGMAALQPTQSQGFLVMIFFGIGTLPIMIASAFSFHQLMNKLKSKVQWAPQAILIISGLFLVLRGSNLGISNLSPEIKQQSSTEQPVMECCKKDNCD